MAGSSSILIGSESSLPNDFDKALPESSSESRVKPILDPPCYKIPGSLDAERAPCGDKVTTVMQGGEGIAKEKVCSGFSQDMSQISGPDEKSRLTPLSQCGFRDPASVGGGQQLTLLSIEVLLITASFLLSFSVVISLLFAN